MRPTRIHILGWLAHLALSAGLVSSGLAPGLQEVLSPGTTGTGAQLLIHAARVLSSPVVPVAELLGVPVWSGSWLAAALAVNSALWVAVLAWVARRIRRP